MSPTEFRMVREALGLNIDWLAQELRVTERTIRRWEHGHAAVPDGVRLELEALEHRAVELAQALVTELGDARDIVLTLPSQDGPWPAAWWRSIAYRVAEQVPGLYVR